MSKYPKALMLKLGDIKVYFNKIYEPHFQFHYEKSKNNRTISISKQEFRSQLEALLMLGYEEVKTNDSVEEAYKIMNKALQKLYLIEGLTSNEIVTILEEYVNNEKFQITQDNLN